MKNTNETEKGAKIMSKEWTFKSSSGSGSYTALVGSDGKLLCNCKGWTMRRANAARNCKHTKTIIVELGAETDARGEFLYIVTGSSVAPAVTPSNVVPFPKTAIVPIDPPPPAAPGVMPMLASAMTDAVTGGAFDSRYRAGEWAMEEKIDGHRCVAIVNGGQVHAYARPRAGKVANPTDLPDGVVELLARFPDGTYDGEKVVAGSEARSWDVTRLGAEVMFVIFDVLTLRGLDLTATPYYARRSMLLDVLRTLPDGQTSISTVESVEPSWRSVEAIWARGGEGAILKRLTSRYEPSVRSAEWVKVKQTLAATLEVIGFAAGKSGPHSIIVLRDAAGVETTVKTLNNAMLRQFDQDATRFLGARAVITYNVKTPSGSYRHPRFDHWASTNEYTVVNS